MKNKSINKNNVGKKIKQIRLSNGWTLKNLSDEISKKIGDSNQIAEGVISRWESGISLPNPKRLKAIAQIADITVEELLANPKQDHALKHCKKSLDELISCGDPFPEFPQATFTKKYYDELIDLFKDSLSSYDLDKYSNEEIEEITDKILGDLLLRTPKNTRELLFNITISLENKIYEISGYMGKEVINVRTLNVSEELDSNTVKKALNILKNTQKEIAKLYPNSKNKKTITKK